MRFTLPTLAFLAALAPATLAQELAAQPEGRHGIAMGTWTDPTGSQDGQMQGLLRRADGTLVYGITANLSGLGRDRFGKIQGQLVALDDGPLSGPAISVSGMWMEAGEDHGVFDALLVLDGIHPLVPRLVVGSIQGEFGVMRGGGPEMKASYGRAADVAPFERERGRTHHRAADVAIDAGQEAAAQYLRQDPDAKRGLKTSYSREDDFTTTVLVRPDAKRELKTSYSREDDFTTTVFERGRIQHRAADVAIDADQESAAQYLRQDDLVGRALNADKSSHRAADVAINADQESAAQYLRQDDLVGRALNADKSSHRSADVAINADQESAAQYLRQDDLVGRFLNADKSSHRSADVAIDAGQEAAAQYLRQDDLVGRFLNKDAGPSAADVATGRGGVIVCPYDRGGTPSPVDASREPMATEPTLVTEQAAPQGLPWDLGREGGTRAADLAPKTSFRPADVAPRGVDAVPERVGVRRFNFLNAQSPPVTKTSIFVAIWQL